MSLRTLPLLFINLGGEMLYILDQRLRAQSIPVDKSRKVMHDIIGTMFNKRFMDELFKPQEAYSKKAMRTVFDRLAHASIMRLNTASMDKLYDLMTMAFKYQVSLCLRPTDLLLVTFNHMDAIRSFVEDSPPIKSQVDNVYRLLIQHYASLPAGEFQLIRQTLLEFFEDMHIRVSIFLKDKVQNSNGRFALPINGPVPYGSDIPGTIRYFSDGAQLKSKDFPVTGKYMASLREGSFDMKGDRVTKLGTNMYNVSRPVETQIASSRQKGATASSDVESNNPNPLAKAELNLLAHLMGSIGKETESKKDKGFRINLFQNDAEEEQYSVNRPAQYDFKVINIDFSKLKGNDELSKIMGDLAIPDTGASSSKGDDLLELMDSAS